MKRSIYPISTSLPLSRHRSGGRSILLVLLLLAGALLAVLFLAVSFGSTSIPLSAVMQILLNATGIFHLPRTWDQTSEVIILDVRLPVVVAAGLVGAALAVSGTLFQG